MAYDEHMTAFPDDVCRGCQIDWEYLVPCAVDVVEGLRRQVFVLPFQYGVECPAYKAIVSCADDIEHELLVGGGLHGEGMFGRAGYF